LLEAFILERVEVEGVMRQLWELLLKGIGCNHAARVLQNVRSSEPATVQDNASSDVTATKPIFEMK
jgi:hypothetical protein